MKQIFLNARIFTAEGKVIGNGFLECENGKIIDLGEMPNTGLDLKGKEVVNVNGNNLYPGFIDAHCHIGMLEDALDFEGDDLNESTDPITPNLRGIDGLNPQDRCFTEALSAGITAACTGPGSANPIGGQMAVISLYGECADDMVIKSPAAVKCALGENPKRVYSERKQMPMTRMGNAALIRTQLEKAKRYMEKENPDYDEKCEGLIPVLKGEIPLHCHAHRLDDIFT
ncbi:MAG: amidohydrolase, partial [Oscillospiraceae bacterium]